MRHFFDKTLKYYGQARNRAQRRKSVWNVLLIPFCLGAFILLWHALFRLIWLFHIAIHPNHSLEEFWPKGINFQSGLLSFLMVFPLMPGALAFAFILGNILFWLIPRARKVFNAEAQNYSGTSFHDSMSQLFKIGVWALSIGIIISFVAAYFLKSLR